LGSVALKRLSYAMDWWLLSLYVVSLVHLIDLTSLQFSVAIAGSTIINMRYMLMAINLITLVNHVISQTRDAMKSRPGEVCPNRRAGDVSCDPC